MNEELKLREIIETNFRLGILHTKDVGSKLGERMDGLSSKMEAMAHSTSLLADQMKATAHEMRFTAHEIRQDFNGLADRQTETLEVLRNIGDSSVDLHKEISDLKRRVGDLEDRAS